MGVLLLLAIWRLAPPAHDEGGFVTARAIEHVLTIAADTRPAGQEDHHDVVRDYLAEQLESYGYDVHVQTAVALLHEREIVLKNVVGRKAGNGQSSRALLLMAHYDSVPWGPGAGDNAAAVAALLEVARVLATEQMRCDVIFLFTDGEEIGLLGARMFLIDDPAARDVGMVLNFDARGSSGPSVMFQTSSGNSALINLYARYDPHPVCSSISGDIYRMLPNDTDFTVFAQRPTIQGYNFAFIGDYQNYHRPSDDLAHLSTSSLRHHGMQALAMARALGQANWEAMPRRQDSVYFDVLALFVIRYPVSLAIPIAIGVAVAGIGAVFLASEGGNIRAPYLLLALLLVVVSSLISGGISWVVAQLVGTVSSGRQIDLLIGGYFVLAAVNTIATMRIFSGLRPIEAAAAGILIWCALNIAAAIYLPGGSYLAAWPTLAAAITLIVYHFRPRWRGSAIIAVALSAVTILTVAPIIYLSFLGLRLEGKVFLDFLGLELPTALFLVMVISLSMWLLALPILGRTGVSGAEEQYVSV
jgi:hypothetical protein